MDHSMAGRGQTEPASQGASVEVQDLVRRLVREAVHDRAVVADLSESNIAGETVLLDVEVDGVRCVLVRSKQLTVHEQEILSPREQEIARMIARGYPNKTIAAVLDISTWTVDTYLRRIFAKLGVSSRAAMVARVMEEGLSLE